MNASTSATCVERLSKGKIICKYNISNTLYIS
nr:unnamed protein product [Callosobruchus chinensis]